MSWSYDLARLGEDSTMGRVYQIRLELADTDQTEQLLQDEEIAYCLTLESTRDLAAARGAEWISRIFARQADLVQNPTIKLSFRQRVRHYTALAVILRKRASGSHAPLTLSTAQSNKTSQQTDTNRTGPYFRRGMHDRGAPTDGPNPFDTGTDPNLFGSPASP